MRGCGRAGAPKRGTTRRRRTPRRCGQQRDEQFAESGSGHLRNRCARPQRAFASTRSSLRTPPGRYDRYETSKKKVGVPAANATAQSSHMLKASTAAAIDPGAGEESHQQHRRLPRRQCPDLERRGIKRQRRDQRQRQQPDLCPDLGDALCRPEATKFGSFMASLHGADLGTAGGEGSSRCPNPDLGDRFCEHRQRPLDHRVVGRQ